MRGFLLTWALFLALYLWLAAAFEASEIMVGAVLGGICAAVLFMVRLRSGVDFVLRWDWIRLLALRLPGQALADCALVLSTLSRRPRGTVRAVHFDKKAGARKAEVATRRALVVAGVSLSPNTVAVSIDPERDRLLVHQLVYSSRPPGEGDRLWPL